MADARSSWRSAVPVLLGAGVAAAAGTVLARGAGPLTTAVVVLAGLVLTVCLVVQLRLLAAAGAAGAAESRAEVAVAARLAERTADAEELDREIGTVRSVLDAAARSAPTAFVEEVEVTCLVGVTADGDAVTETRHTTAIGYVPYRAVRLIAAPGGRDRRGRDPRPEVAADDADLAVAVLPLGDGVASRFAVVFLPGLSGRSLRWHTRYAVPGLWDELRATGEQTLRYPVHRGVPDGTATPISRLTMTLLFPAEMAKVDVTERDGHGWARAETTVLDQTRIVWIEEAPDPTTYAWDVVADPGTR